VDRIALAVPNVALRRQEKSSATGFDHAESDRAGRAPVVVMSAGNRDPTGGRNVPIARCEKSPRPAVAGIATGELGRILQRRGVL